MESPEIITPRLRLDPLRASDAPAMFEYLSRPEVRLYQTFEPAELEDVLEYIESSQAHPFGAPGEWFQLGMRRLADDVLIGDVGVHVLGNDPRQAEIGISLHPSHQGVGYATEAFRGVLGHLFDELEKHRVMASVDPRNVASIALLERVGMRLEAHFKQSLWFKGYWADDMIFGLLRSEWLESRKGAGEASET